MDDLTLLTRPLQPNVTVDFIAKDCSSEGFNVCSRFSFMSAFVIPSSF